MARIVLAMSGGVDSSVAAALLCRVGHEVIGVFMRHGETDPAACNLPSGSGSISSPTIGTKSCVDNFAAATLPIVKPRLDHKQGCCTASDAEDARRVAERLGIPFYALNLNADFARIIDYFVAEYTAARTPNPCVMCNNWVKFGKLFEFADSVGAEFVATGHYARLTRSGDSDIPALRRGLDDGKDQAYVLFGVDRKYLPRMMLPIGEYRKPEIREMARELGLRVADKRDSQEICFVSSGNHAEFVRQRRARFHGAASSGSVNDFDGALDTSGEIALADGTVVGKHPGIEGFTIGQRKGLAVAMGEPYYVLHIDAATRRVYIGLHSELARRELFADRVNWLVDPQTTAFRAAVQIRYNSAATPATVEPLGKNRFRVQFDDPCHGVAPGQAAVCYDGDQVLGGGWIE